MGLDMYLMGRKFFTASRQEPPKENGYPVESMDVTLGYWRKHPDLHEYIVNNFGPKDASGEPIDNCQDIDLSIENIKQIIEAIQNDDLAHKSSGFFFGQSPQKDDDPENYQLYQKEDLTFFGHAVQWHLLETTEKDAWYSVYYRASW